MTRSSARTLAALLLAASAMPTMAQTRAPAQPIPVPRPLGPVVARSAQTFIRVTSALAIGNSVFINDPESRQVWMMDSALKSGRPVLDSVSGTGKMAWYGPGRATGGLRRFKNDSLLFTPSSGGGEALILGGDGRVARVAAMPTGVVPCALGKMDAAGWLVCQALLPTVAGPARGTTKGGDSIVTVSRGDSAVVLAVNFRTWDVDTVVRVLTRPRITTTIQTASATRNVNTQSVNALEDRWTMFHDGTVAVARAVDYHLDIINTKGQVTHGPKAPYEWRRMTDADKDHLLDSIRKVDSTRFLAPPPRAAGRAAFVRGTPPPDSGAAARGAPGRGVLGTVRLPSRLPPDEWPSFWPPFAEITQTLQALMVTDLNDRIWVAERPPVGVDSDSTHVYGIFDRTGKLIDRVRMPSTQSLMGFGPDNTVYVMCCTANFISNGAPVSLLKMKFK